MKKITSIILLLLAVSITMNAQTKKKIAPAKVLRHVVLFKFKETSSAEDVKKVEAAFRDLPKKIKVIKSYEWGLNNSPENLNQGFTHCFFLTFASEKDRAIYLPHPDHKAFGAILGPHLDKVLVIDYWVDK
jgi:Stress responsive A/B Barrel Domain